jgi:thiopurine S-methyltransferase
MDVKYWIEKWNTGDLGFHQTEVEANLLKHFTSLSPGVVFVPMCGKSFDMVWLASKGWKVIGVEVSPIACKTFFEQNKISYETKERADFVVYLSEKIDIWCGDFFKTNSVDLTGITAVYDRAALIALPKDLRMRYAAHLTENLLAKSNSRIEMLLIALEYPQEKVQGPPFSVEASEVRELYSKTFVVEELEREEDLFLPANNQKFSGVHVFEAVYWLKTYALVGQEQK